jgi:hypothetical protein
MELDWILYALAGLGGLAALLLPLPLLLKLGRRHPREMRWGMGILLIVSGLGAIAVDARWRPVGGIEALIPASRKPTEEGFVTSKSCRACHPSSHESWHETYHRTMTQPARPDTVVGAFDGRALSSNYGATAKVERQGDEFWVEFSDIELLRNALEEGLVVQQLDHLPLVRRQVVMTTGSHFFQVYWVQSQNRQEYLQFPWRWHITEKRWIHGYDAFVGPESDWQASPTKGNFSRVWNGDCTPCHTLGPRPGYDVSTNRFVNSQVSELGISCESCHSPGLEHIRLQQDPLRRYFFHLGGQSDSSIVNPIKCNSHVSSEICGQCHSHSLPLDEKVRTTGRGYRAGGDFSQHLRRAEPYSSADWQSQFWKDGTERAAGREFNGLAISACYLKGELSCSTCHSSHRGDRNHLITPQMLTNQACLPCHQEHVLKPQAHTHHGSGSSGSLCYNCHMPHTSLALLKTARSHRIDSPQVTPLSSDVRPNACNLCHLDKSAGWTADRLHEWYGTLKPALSHEEQTLSAGALWLLRGDAGQRAVTAWHLGWEPAQKVSGTDWMTPLLAPLLEDPYTAVRFIANKSLSTLPGFSDWPNEFDSSPATRQRSRMRLDGLWQKSPGRIMPRKNWEPLFDSQGLLQRRVLEGIRERRDDHPVRVDE